MLLNVAKIIIGFLIPKTTDGSFKPGIQHTTLAAAIIGACNIFTFYKLTDTFYTRKEAIIQIPRIASLEKDTNDTKLFTYLQIQKLNNNWDTIKSRLDKLDRHLQRMEGKKEESLSLRLEAKPLVD